MFYDRDSETCEMCTQGTYQDQLAQFECISCGDNFTTITIRSVSQQDCIGKYSDFWVLENMRPMRMSSQDTYQEKLTQFECTWCDDGFTTITIRSVSQQDCIGECWAM